MSDLKTTDDILALLTFEPGDMVVWKTFNSSIRNDQLGMVLGHDPNDSFAVLVLWSSTEDGHQHRLHVHRISNLQHAFRDGVPSHWNANAEGFRT